MHRNQKENPCISWFIIVSRLEGETNNPFNPYNPWFDINSHFVVYNKFMLRAEN